ncbi:MAG: redoxin domain-containing protein [Deltaproteobacteria bacterium]|nr:redoxin domain-containing protein [Deltaproteobacteria bacterium]
MSNNNKLFEKGDKAPEFIANTYDGKNISLSKLKKAGPVVLIFIRGFS